MILVRQTKKKNEHTFIFGTFTNQQNCVNTSCKMEDLVYSYEWYPVGKFPLVVQPFVTEDLALHKLSIFVRRENNPNVCLKWPEECMIVNINTTNKLFQIFLKPRQFFGCPKTKQWTSGRNGPEFYFVFVYDNWSHPTDLFRIISKKGKAL